MKEEPVSHQKEEPKSSENNKHEKETSKKESVKNEKEAVNLNVSSFEKAKMADDAKVGEEGEVILVLVL